MTKKPICTAKSRCQELEYALEHAARGALFLADSINMRTGESNPPAVVLQLRGGGLGALVYCPWCGVRIGRSTASR